VFLPLFNTFLVNILNYYVELYRETKTRPFSFVCNVYAKQETKVTVESM